MSRTARAEQSTYDTSLPAKTVDVNQLTATGGPDIVVAPAESDIQKLAEDEKFMHEMVDIIFFTDNSPGASRHVEMSINTGGITGKMRLNEETGEMMPGTARGGKSYTRVFEREKVYTVPRFVVETMAHAKIATLKQIPVEGRIEPMSVNTYTFAYPFNVVRDPNPAGKAWFEKVKRDPV